MKQVKDENNGRKCLYFVDEDANAELTRRLLNGISHSLTDDPTTVDWVVEEMKKNHCENFVGDWDDEPTTSMMSKESEDGRYTMYWNDYGEIEIWGDENISDSRKIKDTEMRKVYLGTIPTGRYFNLQGKDWRVIENKRGGDTVVCEMIGSGEIKEFNTVTMVNLYNSISDSRRIKDENTPDVLDGVLFIAFEDGTEDDMIAEVNKHANESDTIDGVQYETYETDNSDGVAMIDMCAATGDANAFVKALLNKWGIAENVADLEFEASDEMREAVNDSRVNDMTKPARLRGYAEKVRANRRKKNDEQDDEKENEKQDVADSRWVRDSYSDDTILHFHTGRGGRYNNQGYTTYEGVYEKGLTDFALTYGATTEGNDEYQDGQELIDGNGKSLGAKYGDMVGYLDWDGDYDSDSFMYLNEVEFDDSAFQTIVSSDEYLEPNVRAYIANLVIDNLSAYTLNNLPTYNDNDYEDTLDDIINDICKDLGISNGYVRDTVRDILDQMANQ